VGPIFANGGFSLADRAPENLHLRVGQVDSNRRIGALVGSFQSTFFLGEVVPVGRNLPKTGFLAIAFSSLLMSAPSAPGYLQENRVALPELRAFIYNQ
jgi:hypothetical protein